MTEAHLHIRDEGQGRPVVFIHGWSCPSVFFDGQVTALKSHARCIVPDLPGHGQTSNRLPLTIEAAADALYTYLISQGLRDVVLCGWSMGALVAYSIIERYGTDRIASMVAVDMSPKVLNSADWKNGTLNGLNATQNKHVLDGIVADWARLPGRIALRLYAQDAQRKSDLVSFAKQEIQKADPNLLTPMWASLSNQDFRRLLNGFPVPLHLAAGLQSQLYGPDLYRWHEEMVPVFHLHEFEKSGHTPHLEESEKFNAMVLDLVRS